MNHPIQHHRSSFMRYAAALSFSALLFAGPAVAQEAALEPDAALMERARAVHEEAVVIDAHADIVISESDERFFGPDGLSRVAPEKLAAGGIDAIVMSVAVGPGPRTAEGDAEARAEADAKLAAILKRAEDHADTIVVATTADEVEAAHSAGKTAFIVGFQNARSLQKDVSALDTFYAAGARVFGLNHLAHNDFSDSSRPAYDGETKSYEPPAHNGLSKLGEEAIKRINALGGVIDVSQMSKEATLQAAALSTAPVIASHSNVKALSDVTRNLSDEEIDAIATGGGVIHLSPFGAYLIDLSDPVLLASIKEVRLEAGLPEAYAYPYELYWEIEDLEARGAFISAMRAVLGPSSIGRLIDHIDYVVARTGINHVGIGTDFNHGGGVAGFADASEALNVTAGLLERGYAADDIKKIWGGNFLRVMRAAAKGATN